MIYIDASNQVLGRLASIVAKNLLKGENVTVVNAEKAVVIGNPEATIEFFKTKIARGTASFGPFYPKKPDMIFRRVVRAMLPFKTARGKEAFKRLKVFISIPENLREKKFTAVKGVENKGERKFITMKELAERV
jgi:large subunit ribosomal protein L13